MNVYTYVRRSGKNGPETAICTNACFMSDEKKVSGKKVRHAPLSRVHTCASIICTIGARADRRGGFIHETMVANHRHGLIRVRSPIIVSSIIYVGFRPRCCGGPLRVARRTNLRVSYGRSSGVREALVVQENRSSTTFRRFD